MQNAPALTEFLETTHSLKLGRRRPSQPPSPPPLVVVQNVQVCQSDIFEDHSF